MAPAAREGEWGWDSGSTSKLHFLSCQKWCDCVRKGRQQSTSGSRAVHPLSDRRCICTVVFVSSRWSWVCDQNWVLRSPESRWRWERSPEWQGERKWFLWVIWMPWWETPSLSFSFLTSKGDPSPSPFSSHQPKELSMQRDVVSLSSVALTDCNPTYRYLCMTYFRGAALFYLYEG